MPDRVSLADHVLRIDIQAPRQSVWDEITRTSGVQKAVLNTLLETDFEPGSHLRYCSRDRKRVFVVGKVIEVVPPRRFVHTYMFTFRPEEPTVVTWELEEIPGGTRVTLTHSGWTNQAATHKGVVGGWREILDLLKRLLETGDVPAGTRFKYAVQSSLMFLLPKSTQTDVVAKSGW